MSAHDSGRLLRALTPTAKSPPPTVPLESGAVKMFAKARASTSIPLLDPSQIGNYRILRLLGEGGMGAVYLAEQQEPVARQVALKVIHTGLVTPGLLLRFHAERNALARLAHPNVAVLHEAGTTEDGFPFFAMEHVPESQNLDTHCDHHRLTIEERLALFVQTCRGVQHAHQKGVLHRDLKPSNVLVGSIDGQQVVKVIDFGLAKSLDETPLNEKNPSSVSLLIGTPAYMSPEVIEGSIDLDTRTDVYSLGVMLSELLVDSRPMSALTALYTGRSTPPEGDPVSRPSAQASLASREALKARRTNASKLQRRLAGDLDGIVCRALARNRDDRYASVSELAADIERHLRFEPVSVRPPTLAYLLRKFVRRHRSRLQVGLGALAMVLLAIGALWQTRQAANQRTQLATELNREVERIEWLQRVAYQLPLSSRKDEDEVIRAAMLRIASRPDLRATGLVSYALGRGQLALGDATSARQHFEESLEAGYDAPEVRLALGWTLSQLYDQRLDIVRRHADPDLRKMERERADRELRQPALKLIRQGTTTDWIAPELLEATLAMQEDEFDLAIDRGRSAAGRLGWLYEAHFLVGRALTRQAEQAWELDKDIDRAEDLYRSAEMEITTGLHVGRSDPLGHRLLCNVLGDHLNLLVRFSRAGFDPLQEETLATCRTAAHADPKSAEPLIVQGRAWHGLAEIQLWDLGEDPQTALAKVEETLRPFSQPTGVRRASGEALRLLGRAAHTEATYLYRMSQDPQPAFQRAVDYFRSAIALDPRDADSLSRLADALSHRASWRALRGLAPDEDLQGAIDSAQRANALQPEMFSAFYSLGRTLCSRADYKLKHGTSPDDDLAAAEAAFLDAQSLEPSSTIVLGGLAQVALLRADSLAKRGEDSAAILSNAIRWLDQAIDMASDGTYYRFQKGQSLIGLARNSLAKGEDPTEYTSAARRSYFKGFESLPNIAGTWIELADASLIEARWDLLQGVVPKATAGEAEHHARRGLELDPSRADGHLMLAWAHLARASGAKDLRKRLLTSAQAEILQAIDMAPGNALHHLALARLAWIGTREADLANLQGDRQAMRALGLQHAAEAENLDSANAEATLLHGALLALDPTQRAAGEALMAAAKSRNRRLSLDW